MKKLLNKSLMVNVIVTICIVTMINIIGYSQTNTYPIVGTGQTISYDTAVAITMPTPGQPFYGQNSNHPGNMRSYTNHGNGTVTDNLTGLMWMQNDNGTGVLWENALSYAENLTFAGYSDWRLPDTKELQSIVDYTRSPAKTSSAAINPIFNCTRITNEGGAADYPWYWSNTTFSSSSQTNGASACYVCFGRAMGYFSGLGWTDIHGAGCQRSDPKPRSFAGYTHNGNGYYNPNAPQGDAVRIYNYVRLVRNGSSTGINENKDNHLFNVYPNPVSDELTIEMKGVTEKVSFELFNSIGQIVQNGTVIEKTVIQTNNLATGVYLIKLQYGNTSEVKKLIKE